MKDTCIIACGVFRSDLTAILNSGALKAEVCYLPGGLHTEPDRLRAELQNAVDEASKKYRTLVLLYGLCGRGVAGIRSGTSTLRLPKVHDCISLFLGGAAEYRRQFSHAPGTYYISAGWYQEQVQPKGKQPSSVEYPEAYVDDRDPDTLARKYGEDNAQEISGFLDSWKKNYSRAVYIDTGSDNEEQYENHARSMAEENGWEFVKLNGSDDLIVRCLFPKDGDTEVLTVPPGHEIFHDAGSGILNSAPVGDSTTMDRNETVILRGRSGSDSRQIGLGIDAGGTYTDAVIFDFQTGRVLAKAKALTTKWKYSRGIMESVESLPDDLVAAVDVVSVSTTLVTNAIVESNRRNVGLLLMPGGLDAPDTLHHQPTEVIRGRMSIGGDITEDIDPEQIRSVAKEFTTRYHVEAFAVSGYGGSVNPELEIRVRDILKKETGMDVCCGHELSGTLNFSVRAVTAVLNAGVMPIMDEFLREMEQAIAAKGITAPMLVVRGDGSVMNESYAREFPIQTALSGPAASMAGARFLTGKDEALVVDIGGTTSDIGFLESGRVSVCDEGANIGGWATHVKAVDMRTAGLGGDSELLYERGQWTLGPRRVTPVSWLGYAESDLIRLTNQIDASYSSGWEIIDSSASLQFLGRTGKEPDFVLHSREQAVWDVLEDGPLMLREVQERLGMGSWRTVKTGRLESAYCLRRFGLTPTDIYHASGRLSLWNSRFARLYLELVAARSGLDVSALFGMAEDMVGKILGRAVLEKVMPLNESGQTKAGGASGEVTALYSSILNGGNHRIALNPKISMPVIGLGAPANLMMGDAMDRLGAEWTVPENGEVANAVGAVTSEVRVVRSAGITSSSVNGFRIQGLEGCDEHYEELADAEERCLEELAAATRHHARRAGTSSGDVKIRIDTEIARTAEGSELFIRRNYEAEVIGPPDLAVQVISE